jgi:hypothetical protein
MAYTTCVGILGVAASVFPVVYIGIKLVGSQQKIVWTLIKCFIEFITCYTLCFSYICLEYD